MALFEQLDTGVPAARAVVLSSGGLDSTTVMAIARLEGFKLYSLSFDYGQRHRFELEAAERVAQEFNAREHKVIKIDLRQFGGSSLTDNLDVPKDREEKEMTAIPNTYVPARNTIFLSYALAWAEVLQASHIYIGVNAIDYSGYPDCRPEYLKAFQHMANLATRGGVDKSNPVIISAPLLNLSKAEIIRKGNLLGVDYSITHSCYDPSPEGLACGRCDSCQLRRAGFQQANLPDPTRYVSR